MTLCMQEVGFCQHDECVHHVGFYLFADVKQKLQASFTGLSTDK